MKNWLNWQAPIFDFFIPKHKIKDLPLNAVVDVLGHEEGYSHVAYGKDAGWVADKYLEPYLNALPFDCVDLSDIETPDNTDAKQYVIWDGQKQVNMCGEICFAYILDIPLSAILANWKVKGSTLYQRIFKGGKATGTISADLLKLAELAGQKARLLEIEQKKYSPYLLSELLKTNHVIAACNINGITGALRSGRIGHWVVIVDCVQDRQGFGWVDVFNPFNNCIERYSWNEWQVNTRNYPYGIVVENTYLQDKAKG